MDKYNVWKARVNMVVRGQVGLDTDDLPHWKYRDDYDNGFSPTESANRAIRNAKEF
ncbi:MAG: hypothetical protein QQN63_12095 [Nitrosopumilus sp.]